MNPVADALAKGDVTRPFDHEDHITLVGRVGWLTKGFVYLLMGLIAARIATGSSTAASDSEASPSGAVEALSGQPLGRVMLAALAIGLFIYAAWRITTAFAESDGDDDAVTYAHRGAYLVSALTYAVVGFTAVAAAVDNDQGGSSSSDRRVEDITARVLEQPLGRWMVAAAGLALLALATSFAHKAVTRGFDDDIDLRGASSTEEGWIIRLGIAGWLGRSASVALVGVFLVVAGFESDPDEARGLDGALRDLTQSTVGTGLVLATAAGLAMYGLFCLVSARRRKLVGP